MSRRRLTTLLVLLCVVLGPTSIASAGSCDGDVDDNGTVNIGDLIQLLAAWGVCPGCPEDIDGSGTVDVADLLIVLSGWGPCPVSDPQDIELAGRALSDYPYVDFVHTFTEGTSVSIAIDPGNIAGGLSCDVYIVASKSESDWLSDPSLVDVRGASQSVTFNGATIQANTVTLTGSNGLDGDGGINFGVDYDVVCDVNMNGALDGGDLIDGRTGSGFTVVHDTTTLGPFATSSINYSGGSWLGQRTWYPTNIASMDPRPLVVISHGNGHNYTWYDYLQQHLASYGYVVMSHQNNTQPGIETASTTTLTNTDYFLGNLASIGGGIFNGRIDSSRITWIGHSRGGEGVARAFDRLFDGNYVPSDFTMDDIALISSIAPNDYLGRFQSNPHDATYHLLHGTADGDNGGWPNLESDAPFHVFERAEGYRQVTHVHGADHNDFNCCGFNDFSGPSGTQIGRTEAQRVAKSSYLALLAHYIQDNRAARDFLWRQYETLRPIGVDSDTIVDNEYVEGPNAELFVIDDFQTQTSTSVSSSGGSVSGSVTNRVEEQHDDADGTFTWSSGDPMNGMSRGRTNDLSRGSVFDWSPGSTLFLEFEVIAGQRDLTDDTYLSFRACQGTRHPQTTAQIGQTSFSVTLRDGLGTTSTIDFNAYGAGLQEPYQRTGSGSGVGWQCEYETIRIRLTDFLHNGSGLDLSDVEAVRFDVGSAFGSSRGRVMIDDLVISGDAPPTEGAARLAGPTGPRDERPIWRGNDHTEAFQPQAIHRVMIAQPFTVDVPFTHHWQHERPRVTTGTILVLDVDPDLLRPTQSLEPVLYVGNTTAERLNVGFDSGIVVVVVPGTVEVARTPIWFGSAALPEQVDAAWIAFELERAAAAGITALTAEGNVDAVNFESREALLLRAADLVEQHAPTELDLIQSLRASSPMN